MIESVRISKYLNSNANPSSVCTFAIQVKISGHLLGALFFIRIKLIRGNSAA